MAYILGFFAADGNLIKNKRGGCFFSLEICDKDIIEKIKIIMKVEHKIGVRPAVGRHQARYRLQIGSKEIYSDLRKLGFSDHKTYNMTVPNVPEKYLHHFVRGYFDGDGCVWVGFIHKDRRRQTLAILSSFTSCSETFLRRLRLRLEKHSIKGRMTCRKTYFRLCYSVLSSIELYRFMYNNSANYLFLERKRVIFEKFIKSRTIMRT